MTTDQTGTRVAVGFETKLQAFCSGLDCDEQRLFGSLFTQTGDEDVTGHLLRNRVVPSGSSMIRDPNWIRVPIGDGQTICFLVPVL